MFMDFYGVCHDMLYNQAAKFRYMFGGKAKAPMVVRGMIGAGFSAAAQHSQSPYNVFAAVPGLKVVVPSSPYDVKGLLIQVPFVMTTLWCSVSIKCSMTLKAKFQMMPIPFLLV